MRKTICLGGEKKEREKKREKQGEIGRARLAAGGGACPSVRARVAGRARLMATAHADIAPLYV